MLSHWGVRVRMGSCGDQASVPKRARKRDLAANVILESGKLNFVFADIARHSGKPFERFADAQKNDIQKAGIVSKRWRGDHFYPRKLLAKARDGCFDTLDQHPRKKTGTEAPRCASDARGQG